LNISLNIILKKNIKKKIILFYYFNVFLKNKLINNHLNFFLFNFINRYNNLLEMIYNFKEYKLINNLILANFKNKQPKLNILNLQKNTNHTYSIGLILKVLNLYKKSSRRNLMFLKYLISFILKKNLITSNKIIFLIKGFSKNYVKLIYFFKLIILQFNISILYLNPIKKFNKNINLKKKRAIKRRIFKKLIDFNNM